MIRKRYKYVAKHHALSKYTEKAVNKFAEWISWAAASPPNPTDIPFGTRESSRYDKWSKDTRVDLGADIFARHYKYDCPVSLEDFYLLCGIIVSANIKVYRIPKDWETKWFEIVEYLVPITVNRSDRGIEWTHPNPTYSAKQYRTKKDKNYKTILKRELHTVLHTPIEDIKDDELLLNNIELWHTQY